MSRLIIKHNTWYTIAHNLNIYVNELKLSFN